MVKKLIIMEEVLMVLAVFGSISFTIVSIIRSISDHKLKNKLIERAGADEKFNSALSESLKSISASAHPEMNKYPALKWGLLFFFAGIGLITIEYLDFNYNSTLPFGILSTSIALGFLVYYFLIKNELKSNA